MTLLIGVELFVGYLLFYAGVHNRGKYATHPWDALKIGGKQGGGTIANTSEPEAPAGPWESWN